MNIHVLGSKQADLLQTGNSNVEFSTNASQNLFMYAFSVVLFMAMEMRL